MCQANLGEAQHSSPYCVYLLTVRVTDPTAERDCANPSVSGPFECLYTPGIAHKLSQNVVPAEASPRVRRGIVVGYILIWSEICRISCRGSHFC